MKPRTPREIPVLFIRGSEELGRATGFTDKRIHAQWREQGLKYCVSKDGTFLGISVADWEKGELKLKKLFALL